MDKSDNAKREEKILSFWEQEDIFKKSLEKESPKGEFVFYDGPPFATGLPHYGHLLPGTIKDVIPRYKTMQGYHVRRRWGWDCHGLPLEAKVEEKLGVQNKQEVIDGVGVAGFNKLASEAVLEYTDDWKKIIPRTGRFVDMEDDYRTMDPEYTESVWWVFKTLYDKGLIYQGFKSLHLSPVLGTELSNIEVALGYKEITDFAVTVKLPLVDEPETSLLVWTTTPWTLPGNMAAAVHNDLEYVKVTVNDERVGGTYILAKPRIDEVLKELSYTIEDTFLGSALVGRSYIPPFSYYKNEEFENKENAWKIYAADYVSAEDGTGAVHIAPAFGAEDLALAQEHRIPIVHHINRFGKFVDIVTDFKGLDAKPKENPQATDILIIKHLAHAGVLFAKEKVTHRYPHSWRTDEPLLNYAMDSWFVKVPEFKDRMVEENKKINWVPKDIGEKRFGNWIKGSPDWSISRSRFWGAPLPVWEGPSGKRLVIGSLEELLSYTKKSGNTYTVLRHGESEINVADLLNHTDSLPADLTDAGIRTVKRTAENLKKKNITKIITSPLKRTVHTAQLVAETLGLSEKDIMVDERLREINFGEFNEKPREAYLDFFKENSELLSIRPDGGENWNDVKNRVGELLYDTDRLYTNENILFVTHDTPAYMLQSAARGHNPVQCAQAIKASGEPMLEPGMFMELPFRPLPHDDEYVLNFHRPYIDAITLYKDGEKYTRILDVADCWFESGSMPYAQQHYPFENTDIFNPKKTLFRKRKGFPAEFISEGLDQTRGWFYSLLVLGVGLFNTSPYKNVIVHGLVLAEDGKKMSKKLGNYPPITDVINRHGADALRYYLLASPLMRAEDIHFSEKEVAGIASKLIGRLDNVYAFYKLYADDMEEKSGSTQVLDVWITERLFALIHEVTDNLDRYELDRAARPFMEFVDDLSTWYVRRSRERIKKRGEDAMYALGTLRFVFENLSKLMAPFTPFFAEYLYKEVRDPKDPQSVHLTAWPKQRLPDTRILANMDEVRHIVSLALEARQQSGFRVRQPLASITVPRSATTELHAYQEIIAAEVNVDAVLLHDEEGVVLDTNLTLELTERGQVREFIRAVQGARKQLSFTPEEPGNLVIFTTLFDFYERNAPEIKEMANIKNIELSADKAPERAFDVSYGDDHTVSFYLDHIT